MSTPSTARERAERVADVVVHCLKHFLDAGAPQEDGAPLATVTAELLPYREDERAARELRFSGADGLQVEAHLFVRSGGGNVYGVSTQMGGREEQAMDVCLPDLEASPGKAQSHTEPICRRLLAELEQVDGERSLREAAGRKQKRPAKPRARPATPAAETARSEAKAGEEAGKLPGVPEKRPDEQENPPGVSESLPE